MSVRQIKGKWYYRLTIDGVLHTGTCEGCNTETQAKKFDLAKKTELKKLAQTEDVKELDKVYNKIRDEKTGGNKIKLVDAFELAMQKPRSKKPSAVQVSHKRAHFSDFVAFMTATYPDTEYLHQITIAQAEAYISLLRSEGRFQKEIAHGSKKSYKADGSLSNSTINKYHTEIAEVFNLLRRDAAIIDNPFSFVPKLNANHETKEAYTMDELQKIYDNADDFLLPLFTIALNTALRCVDICLLEWAEVDLINNVICRDQRKTGNPVQIPIMPALREYLIGLKQTANDSKYVLPKHAEIYLRDSSYISKQVKKLLDSLDIVNTKKVGGRAISVKDIHSCRHTFCTLAGISNIPLTVVQSIVGHMSPEMTAHYSAHVSLDTKRKLMALMPTIGNTKALPDRKTEIINLLDNASDEQIDKMLAILRG